jgi:hypothetical protein
LPAATVAALRGNYSDLRIKLLVNRPEQASAFVFDELTLDNFKPLPRAVVEDYVIPLPKGMSLGNVAVGQALVKRSGSALNDLFFRRSLAAARSRAPSSRAPLT